MQINSKHDALRRAKDVSFRYADMDRDSLVCVARRLADLEGHAGLEAYFDFAEATPLKPEDGDPVDALWIIELQRNILEMSVSGGNTSTVLIAQALMCAGVGDMQGAAQNLIWAGYWIPAAGEYATPAQNVMIIEKWLIV